jgi:hypothetical protein
VSDLRDLDLGCWFRGVRDRWRGCRQGLVAEQLRGGQTEDSPGVAGELLTGVRHLLDRALKLLLHFLCLLVAGDQAGSAPRQGGHRLPRGSAAARGRVRGLGWD